jgi:hypothetical protein
MMDKSTLQALLFSYTSPPAQRMALFVLRRITCMYLRLHAVSFTFAPFAPIDKLLRRY